MLLFFVDIEIVAEARHGHQSLHEEVLQRDEEPELRHAGDVRVELPADLVLHEDDLFPEEALALRRFGATLPVGGERRDLAKTVVDRLEVLQRHRPAGLDQPGELAVNHEIRVAPDGRREVAVVGGRERVVAAALLAVERLALRPEEQVGKQSLLRFPFDRLQDLLERGRRDFVEVAFELVAEVLENLAQVDEAVGVRGIVDAVDRGLLREQELLRDRLVRRQHELLDQAVSQVARLRHDADDEALVVEHDVGVGKVEVDRAARLPPLAQLRREGRHVAKVLEERSVAVLVGVRRPALEQPRDLRVGHPLGALDDPLDELGGEDAPLPVRLDERRENEAVDSGIQGAETVGEVLGQHRQDPARKIDARAPGPRLVVERRPFPHVVGDVGDVHSEPEAGRRTLDLDRVVEVLRGLSVDRDHPPVPEVAAAEEIFGAHAKREALGFLDDGLREPRGQTVGSQHDLDVDSRLPE